MFPYLFCFIVTLREKKKNISHPIDSFFLNVPQGTFN